MINEASMAGLLLSDGEEWEEIVALYCQPADKSWLLEALYIIPCYHLIISAPVVALDKPSWWGVSLRSRILYKL